MLSHHSEQSVHVCVYFMQAKPPGSAEKSVVGGSLLAPKKYSVGPKPVPPPVPPNKPSVPPKSGTLTAKIHAAKLEQQIT